MILRTADQIRTYNKAFKTLNDNSITPYIPDAEEKYIKKYLGSTLYAALDAYITAATGDDEEYEALLPYVYRASSRFTLLMAAPTLDINLGDTGFTTSNTGSFVPASRERVARFTEQLEMLAWENIETMLEFLEENQDDYPLWVASDAYTYATSNFIRTAKEFDQLVSATITRYIFHRFRPQMDNIELFRIESIISEDLADEIREQITDEDVSALNQVLLNFIKPAIANLVVVNIIIAAAEARETSFVLQFKPLQREEYKKLGEYYIMEIQKYLDENADDYPLYTASDLYDEDKTTNDMHEVDEDDSVVSMGSTPI